MKSLVLALCSAISTACFAAPTTPSNVLVFSPDNHAALTDEINGKTAAEFLNTFLSLEDDRRLLYISSPGGSVGDGMKMIQVINDERAANKNLRVVCYVDEAASMAFALVQAVCDERHGGLTSTLMQHQATYGVQGNDNQILSRVKMITSILKALDKIQAKRIGITVEELRKRSSDEWWTVGQEAVEANTLDHISPAVCTKDLLEKTRIVKMSSLFFSGDVKFSSCPLITGPIEIIQSDGKPASEIIKKSFERKPLADRVIRFK